MTAAELRASEDAMRDAQEEDYRLQRTDGGFTQDNDEVDSEDDSLATGWLRCEYVLVDYDGDGIAERRLIYRLADKILSNEETDQVQIATTSPIINTHRWDGMSISSVSDIQRLENRPDAGDGQRGEFGREPAQDGADRCQWRAVCRDRRPSGFPHWRDRAADAPGRIGRRADPFNAAQILPVLSHVDDMAEKRTGVSKQQQGPGLQMRCETTAPPPK